MRPSCPVLLPHVQSWVPATFMSEGGLYTQRLYQAALTEATFPRVIEHGEKLVGVGHCCLSWRRCCNGGKESPSA